MKRIILLILSVLLVFVSCDVNGSKKKEELKRLEEMEKVKQKKEKEKKLNILATGNIGLKKANDELAGKKFIFEVKTDNGDMSLIFNKETNSCRFRFFGSKYMLDDIYGWLAEYEISDKKITFNFAKASKIMSNLTKEEAYLMYKKGAYEIMEEKGFDKNNFDKLWQEHLEEFKQKKPSGISSVDELCEIEAKNSRVRYSNFLKQPQEYTGTLSEDGNTITINSLKCPIGDTIKTINSIVLKKY